MLYEKDPLNAWQRANHDLHRFVRDDKVQGRETSSNNRRYRLRIYLLLFCGEYQTYFRVLIDKIPNIFKV